MKETVKRSYQFEIRAEEGEGGKVILGRPIVYNSRTNLGYFDEIIESGALNNTDLSDVRFLVNHDTKKIPLARSCARNQDSTMQMQVDNEGLKIRVMLDTENNAEARALYSAVQRRDITGMSFLFDVDSETWENMDTDHPLRRIRSISIVEEVSAVTFPAYEATEIDARNKKSLEAERRKVEEAREKQDGNSRKDSRLKLLKHQIEILGGK